MGGTPHASPYLQQYGHIYCYIFIWPYLWIDGSTTQAAGACSTTGSRNALSFEAVNQRSPHETSARFDDNGWLVGRVDPLPVAGAWTLLSPERSSRLDPERLAHQARRFFAVELAVAPDKRYPEGWPVCDAATFTLANDRGPIGAAEIITFPADRAAEAMTAARAAVAAMGGAGFDALLPRTTRIWQIRTGDTSAPLLAAAILASLFLAPILDPGARAIFGIKGARTRLAL